MTNREVLAKFIEQTFNIEIEDDFYIRCKEIHCPGYTNCEKCPGNHLKNYFWDEEFIGDENVQINNNTNERVAIREISW